MSIDCIQTQCQQYLDMVPMIHQVNKDLGWWDFEGKGNVEAELAKINLISCEIGEMLEAIRKDLMDDKLPHRTGEEVELADVLIRTLDYIGYVEASVNLSIKRYPQGKQLLISEMFYQAANLPYGYEETLGDLICLCVIYANRYNLDLKGAVEEKLAFNKQRADHKPENRAKKGGKKF